MIGIFCLENEKPIVREFFELFKTPWEFCTAPSDDEVIISTCHDLPPTNARLIILSSPKTTEWDRQYHLTTGPCFSGAFVTGGEINLPLYGMVAPILGGAPPLLTTGNNREAVAVEISGVDQKIVRLGYSLFQEVDYLLSHGQPPRNASTPAVDVHIALLRHWILSAGITFIEIPPIPWGYQHLACITHDVDFAGIRYHRLDRTFWGFIHRALLVSLIEVLRRRRTMGWMMKNWGAVFSLPLIFFGLMEDPWDEFDAYAQIDRKCFSTFFVIPIKNYPGQLPGRKAPAARATRYEVTDIRRQVNRLKAQGFEIGLHGLDAWLDAGKGACERLRVVEVTGLEPKGVRIHWLYFDESSPVKLEQAGFDYDTSLGFNETIGYRNGTAQAFRPTGTTWLLELPLLIQDTALFYPRRMGLNETQAWGRCRQLLDSVGSIGGAVTLSWHTRSLSPERQWDHFYQELLTDVRGRGAWFGTAGQVVAWFRKRRSVKFEACQTDPDRISLRLKCEQPVSDPGMILRVHRSTSSDPMKAAVESNFFDLPYFGETSIQITPSVVPGGE